MKRGCTLFALVMWVAQCSGSQNYALTQDSFNNLTLKLIATLDELINEERHDVVTLSGRKIKGFETLYNGKKLWVDNIAYKDRTATKPYTLFESLEPGDNFNMQIAERKKDGKVVGVGVRQYIQNLDDESPEHHTVWTKYGYDPKPVLGNDYE